jgi:hypothetical protein
MCKNYCRITYYLKVASAAVCICQFLPRKLTFYGTILESVECVALVHKATDKIQITIFSFIFFEIKKINELVVTSDK